MKATAAIASGVVRLGEVAFARSGDKGSGANVAVFSFRSEDYQCLCRNLTGEVVARFFSRLGPGRVTRYEVPNLQALNFVLEGVLDGGASRSLRVDAQGKTLGQAILELRLDWDPRGGGRAG